jgi:hypothetical protein
MIIDIVHLVGIAFFERENNPHVKLFLKSL